MKKTLAIAGTLLILMMLTSGLAAVSAASADGRPASLRCEIVWRGHTYDKVRRHHSVLRVGRTDLCATVNGVPRYRVAKRTHRYIYLRLLSAVVRSASTNTRIIRGTPASVGLPSSASSAHSGSSPAAANDGQAATRWAASSSSCPQWWMVDLGTARRISGVQADWYRASKCAYRYRVEASLDGITFTTVADRSKNLNKGITSDALDVSARYVRIQVLGVSGTGWASANEITVYADETLPSDPGPTPTPTPRPTPSATQPDEPPTPVYNVWDYGAHHDGVTNDADHIQCAVDACLSTGGSVYFPPGTYGVTTPVKLRTNTTQWVTLWGYGATIRLNGCQGFLRLYDPVEQQTFRKYRIKGFSCDASARNNTVNDHGYYFLGGENVFSNICVKRCNIEDIEVRDVNIYGAPSNPGSGATAISLGVRQYDVTETTVNHVRRITIENVRISGGDAGIIVICQSPYNDDATPYPKAYSTYIDDVTIGNIWFDSGLTTPFPFKAVAAIQIGGASRGGSNNLIHDCYLRGAGDDLIEVDNMVACTVRDVEAHAAHNVGFLVCNFGYPLNASPPGDVGTSQYDFVRCHYYDDGEGRKRAFGYWMGWGAPQYAANLTECYRTKDGVTTKVVALQ